MTRTLTMATALLVAAATQASTTYTVRRGDSLSEISQRVGVTVGALVRANHIASPHWIRSGQTLIVPTSSIRDLATAKRSGASKYVVHKGDTRGKIARKLGISESRLNALNPGVRWTRLQIGQALHISGEGAPVALHNSEIAHEGVVLRGGPHSGSKKLSAINKGAFVKVLRQKGAWLKVVANGVILGWLESTQIAGRIAYAAGKTVAKATSPTADSLIDKAFGYRGVRYRWGGTSRSGIDCSGFTSRSFAAVGVTLPRTSIEQSKVGLKVARNDLQKGDLVFFRTGRSIRINHVGIYIGEGRFIHASSGGGRVQVNKLSEAYYNKRFATGRRIRAFAMAEQKQNLVQKVASTALVAATSIMGPEESYPAAQD